MTAVLVLELDEAIRGNLHEILSTEDHFDVVEVQTNADAFACLAAPVEGMIVVCSNQHADHHLSTVFFARVMADADLATRHQYILLSTNVLAIPQELRVYLAQLGAPVLPKPFDLDAFLGCVCEAAKRLAASQAPARAPKRRRLQIMQTSRGPRGSRSLS